MASQVGKRGAVSLSAEQQQRRSAEMQERRQELLRSATTNCHRRWLSTLADQPEVDQLYEKWTQELEGFEDFVQRHIADDSDSDSDEEDLEDVRPAVRKRGALSMSAEQQRRRSAKMQERRQELLKRATTNCHRRWLATLADQPEVDQLYEKWTQELEGFEDFVQRHISDDSDSDSDSDEDDLEDVQPGETEDLDDDETADKSSIAVKKTKRRRRLRLRVKVKVGRRCRKVAAAMRRALLSLPRNLCR